MSVILIYYLIRHTDLHPWYILLFKIVSYQEQLLGWQLHNIWNLI
jgi:hypothetical protein